jgi:hypothetical protein
MPKKPRSAFPEGSYTVLIGDGQKIGGGNWAVPYVLVPSEELEKTKKVVEDLVSAIMVMPCFWEDYVGEDLAERAKRVMEWQTR